MRDPALARAKRRGRTVLALTALAIVALGWAPAPQVEHVRGTVVTDTPPYRVDHDTGGIVRTIHIRANTRVQVGDPLVELENTTTEAELRSIEDIHDRTTARIARLEALIAGGTRVAPPRPGFPPAVLLEEQASLDRQLLTLSTAKASATTRIERATAERHAKLSRANGLQQQIATARQTLERLQRIQDVGGVQSRLDEQRERIAQLITERDTTIADTKTAAEQIRVSESELAEAQARAIREAGEDLARTRTELAAHDARLATARDRTARSIITSPIAGIVQSVTVNNSTELARASTPIAIIIPEGARPRLEVRITPRQRSQLREGMTARITIDGYDQTVYGTISGSLDTISPTSSLDQATNMALYAGTIFLAEHGYTYAGRFEPLLPGLDGEASILAENRTLMSYLIRPITRLWAHSLTEE